MRIIGGRRRGTRLTAPVGTVLRPTADRVRESLFNILEHGDTPPRGATFLDGFAGTGAVGLEALSRGAAYATFIENSRLALRALRDNIAKCGQGDHATILETDIVRAPRAGNAMDIVFLDPPYKSGLLDPSLAHLRRAGWIGPDTLVVTETAANEEIDIAPDFTTADTRRYGAAQLHFLRLTSD